MKSTAVALSLLALFGSCSGPLEPRKNRDPSAIPLLAGLEPWLSAREALVPGIKPGVEAGIVWADPQRKEKTPIALVYLPGYTATRGEISPVTERMAKTLGANLFFVRPTGQGTGFEGHRTVTAADWLSDGLEAFEIGQRLGDRVVLVATSTGGTLATWLILGPARLEPAATILISPNLTPKNNQSEMLLWPGNEWLLAWMVGDKMEFKPENDIVARYWDTTHHSHSLIPMMQLVDGARKLDFTRWPTPVLVVYDPEDDVVAETVTVRLFSKAPQETTTLLRWTAAEGENHHVLAGEALSPGGTGKMVDAGIAFLKRVLGTL